jgi:hypothetical protein
MTFGTSSTGKRFPEIVSLERDTEQQNLAKLLNLYPDKGSSLPSSYSMMSLYKAWAIAIDCPAKYALKYKSYFTSIPAGASQ